MINLANISEAMRYAPHVNKESIWINILVARVIEGLENLKMDEKMAVWMRQLEGLLSRTLLTL